MKGIHVLGLDPGIASTGFAVGVMWDRGLTITRLGVWRSSPEHKKRNISKGSDKSRRTRALARFLWRLCEEYTPAAVCSEALSVSPGMARSAGVQERIFGALDSVFEIYGLPVVAIPPREIKALTGAKSATKLEVEAAVRPHITPEALQRLETKGLPDYQPKGQHEHAFDAAGSIVAGMVYPELMTIRRTLAMVRS